MNKLTEIDNQASDALLELQVEREHAETFNSILINDVVETSAIEYPYEKSVAKAMVCSMYDSLVKIDEAAIWLGNLLSELKTMAKDQNNKI